MVLVTSFFDRLDEKSCIARCCRTVYEFTAGSAEAMATWMKALQQVHLKTPVPPCFVAEGHLFKFPSGIVYDLNIVEDKQRLLLSKACPCGKGVAFYCECHSQGYCSLNCEFVHKVFHAPHCTRTGAGFSTNTL